MRSSLPDTPKAPVRTLKSILHYLKPYRLQVAGACLALIFTSGATLGMGAGLRYLVDKGLGQGNQALLDQALWILLGVVCLLSVATYTRYYLVSWIGEKVVADIRSDAYSHLMRLHVGYFETARTGELLSRLTTDTTLLQAVIGSSISIALRNTLMFVGGCTLLVVTSAHLTGIVFLLLPITVTPIILLGRKVRSLSRVTQAQVASMNAHAGESISAVRTLHAMALIENDIERFNGSVQAVLDTALGRIRMRAFLTGLVILLIFGSVIGVLWVGGREMLAGTITPGDLSAFVFYSVIVAGAVGALSEVATDLQRAAGAAERLMELMALEPEIISPAAPASLPLLAASPIMFDRVTFTYPARPNRHALKNVSFIVQPGETVALVGPSGAGKSTIFQLLLRFYDPDSGDIKIGGTNIRTLLLEEWRGAIGMVPQDPVIFSASARDNIRLGKEAATQEEIVEAARAAHTLEFIDKLPQGMDSHLGEKGVQLSGGQKQRVAIARALVRNPGLLLLDEATSALDGESERLIQEAFSVVSRSRTTLVIAHRLSTVMNADRILLLHEGEIVAEGTHRELLSHPLYARLAAGQFIQ